MVLEAYKVGKKKKTKKMKLVTKVKIAVVIALILSLYSNWTMLRANYVFRCSAGGMFMSQSKCNELATNLFDSQELSRIQFLSNQ